MPRVWPLLALALLAGCVGAPEDLAPAALDAPGAPALAALVADVPCEAAVGAGTSENLRVLSALALDDPEPTDYAEMAFRSWDNRTLLVVARIAQGGFDLVDVTTPDAPEHLLTWEPAEPGYALDVKFTSDNLTLLIAGDTAITLLDMRDPLAPVVENVHELDESSAHLMTVFPAAGADHLVISKGEGKDLSIFRIEGAPGGRSLVRVAQPLLTPLGDAPRSGGLMELVRSHDTWFEVDPITGAPLLWIANVWFGVTALDVSDPALPVEVVRIPETDPFLGYTHSVQVAHVDGRRLVVASTEYGMGALKVYDATDLAAPRLVATWHLDVPTKPTHNLQVVGSHVFLAHLHEGLFVFDLADLSAAGLVPARLAPVGHFEADGEVPVTLPHSFAGYYGPRDVVVKDGVVHVTEATRGLRSVAFGCLMPGDPTLTSSG